jgi:hypothetical protein
MAGDDDADDSGAAEVDDDAAGEVDDGDGVDAGDDEGDDGVDGEDDVDDNGAGGDDADVGAGGVPRTRGTTMPNAVRAKTMGHHSSGARAEAGGFSRAAPGPA